MSGIAAGVNPAHHVGDVIVPDRWAMPMEVFWNRDGTLPAACGPAGDVSCLGLQLAGDGGRAYLPFSLDAGASAPAGKLPTGRRFRRRRRSPVAAPRDACARHRA